jgi:DNA-binding transcriptional regulator YiaG
VKLKLVIPQLTQLHNLMAHLLATKSSPLFPEEFWFLRKHLGHSSTEISKKIGVTNFTVSRWENGKQKIEPAAERLLKLMVATSRPVEHYPEEVFPTMGKMKRAVKVELRFKKAQWVAV